MNNKRTIYLLLILSILFTVVGGTFAYLTFSLNVTNGVYNLTSHCFMVDYNINNVDGSQDITGVLFPSSNAVGGLNGRVGLKINDSCDLYGTGTLKLHIDDATNSKLTTSASSFCEDRSTLEPIVGLSTEGDCTTAGGRWRGYGDSYCENPNTLERIVEYTNQTDCTNNNGLWTSGGSPLKYAVYNTLDTSQTPLSVGHITINDIGNDISVYDGFIITKSQNHYYIYIWLDGYLTDDTYVDLPFNGTITANAIQNNTVINNVYTVTFDANGGSVNIPSKTVIYHNIYGDLPIPTRSGYRFLGWNGKNKFNEANYLKFSDYTINGDSYVWAPVNLKPNTSYRHSVIRYNGYSGNGATVLLSPIAGWKNANWGAIAHGNSPNAGWNVVFTTNDTGKLYVGYYNTNTQQMLDKMWKNTDVQVEEGTVVTAYEPYYITETTTVVQNKNHVLTALWEEI